MLPLRPHPDWYRKAAKKKLAEIRQTAPAATLADAQLDIARANGFASWRRLIAAINERRASALIDAGAEVDLYSAAAAGDLESVKSFFNADGSLNTGRANPCRIRFMSSAVPLNVRP